jgi:hypothetical protein
MCLTVHYTYIVCSVKFGKIQIESLLVLHAYILSKVKPNYFLPSNTENAIFAVL